jgi:PKD repeat protein
MGMTFTGGTPSSSIVQNPTVTYNIPGTYTVKLVATNICGPNEEEKIKLYYGYGSANLSANTLFAQDFSSSTNPNTYVNATTPTNGQFNSLETTAVLYR